MYDEYGFRTFSFATPFWVLLVPVRFASMRVNRVLIGTQSLRVANEQLCVSEVDFLATRAWRYA